MTEEKVIKENILKVNGSLSLPVPLKAGYEYTIGMRVSIEGDGTNDNHDGTFDAFFRAKPIICEIVTPEGEKILTKDKKRRSQAMRFAIKHCYLEDDAGMESEDFYQSVMNFMIANLKELIDQWRNEKKEF